MAIVARLVRAVVDRSCSIGARMQLRQGAWHDGIEGWRRNGTHQLRWACPATPDKAAAMDPIVTDVLIQCRNVRSLAKYALASVLRSASAILHELAEALSCVPLLCAAMEGVDCRPLSAALM
jgi:hypothetical protein